MQGYYKAPELTGKVFDRDGWFYTGDLGYLGSDGYLRLLGRKDDLIIRGGQNIHPEEIETFLRANQHISRVGVVGIPDDLGGQSIWAFVQLYPGALLTKKEIIDYCQGQIAIFKIPDEIRFINKMPTTSTDKIQRFILRQWAKDELAAV